MKKIIAFCLCCLMALSTAACSGDGTESQSNAGTGASSENSQKTESTTESTTEDSEKEIESDTKTGRYGAGRIG